MSRRVCPWWLGYLLASPIRKLWQDPATILRPYIREGMTVLEPGPGMGFFTLEVAKIVGKTGHVIAVDVQEKMLESLKRRLAKSDLLDRVDVRLASSDSLNIDDQKTSIDFTFAFAVVHEMQDPASFFQQVAAASKANAKLLLVEPGGHVSDSLFQNELSAAAKAGFQPVGHPTIGRSHSVLLEKRP